jgi:hypothetical protein
MQMKTLIATCIVWGATICLIAATMQAIGIGSPNCVPTTRGYIEFYATLFGCGSISVILAVSTALVVKKVVQTN